MSIRTTLLVLLFGGLAGTVLLREQQRGTLEPLDRVHREYLKKNPDPDAAARAAPAATVVFARMDDIDQPNRVFSGWPLEPADWQILFQNLPGYAPQQVALSVPLPAGEMPPALLEAAKSLPGLLTGVPASVMPGDGSKELPAALPVLTVRGPVDAIPEFASVNVPSFPGVPGVDRIEFGPKEKRLALDGDACRVPMLARMGEKVVPTLALQALLAWAAVSPADVHVQTGVAILAGKKLRIPIDEGGFFRYYLSLAPEVPAVNADEFVLTRPAPGAVTDASGERARGSLLWFGYDHKASRTFTLPSGSPASPAELTVRALAAIQTGSFMKPLNYRRQWVPPAAALVLCLWLAHWRKRWLLPGALLIAAALVAVSLYLYRARSEWMPLGPALGTVAASTLLAFLLPPRPRRGKPALLPGTRRTNYPGTATRVPAADAPASPARSEIAPPPVVEDVPEVPAPEEIPAAAQPEPASPAPPPDEVIAPEEEAAPPRAPMHQRKKGKKKRR